MRTYMHLYAVSPYVSMPVCATVSFVLVRLLVFLFFSLSKHEMLKCFWNAYITVAFNIFDSNLKLSGHVTQNQAAIFHLYWQATFSEIEHNYINEYVNLHDKMITCMNTIQKFKPAT